jgi:ferrous iron transport protein B
MAIDKKLKIALAGKPNSGKSSLFNKLTGLNQKIGNFPGITVDKRTGTCQLNYQTVAEIIDLPGIYSLYPRTLDEKIVAEVFADQNGSFYPDCVVLVADATNLKNCMLLLTQLIDLKLPIVLALNMMDLAAQSGQSIDIQELSASLDLPVVMINGRTGQGIDDLKVVLSKPVKPSKRLIYKIDAEIKQLVSTIKNRFNLSTEYEAYQYLQQTDNLVFLSAQDRMYIFEQAKIEKFFPHKYQGAETVMRYGFIQDLLNRVILKTSDPEWKNFPIESIGF